LSACSLLPPRSPPSPYTTLFRSESLRCNSKPWPPRGRCAGAIAKASARGIALYRSVSGLFGFPLGHLAGRAHQQQRDLEQQDQRSEEHTSELQSRENLVCRLLLE